jgi:hypothetical protein
LLRKCGFPGVKHVLFFAGKLIMISSSLNPVYITPNDRSYRSQYVDLAAGWMAGESSYDFWRGKEIFVFSKTSGWVVWSNQSYFQLVGGGDAVSLELQRLTTQQTNQRAN